MSTLRTLLTRIAARHPFHAAYQRRPERTAVRRVHQHEEHVRTAQAAHHAPNVLLSVR